MSYTLAFDPSLNSSGVCVFDGDKPVHYECILPESLREAHRLSYNYNRFCTLLSSFYPLKCVAFECQVPQMRYNRNASGILSLAENIGILKLAIYHTVAFENTSSIVLAIPPGDIKSFATGNSHSDKSAMIGAVGKRYLKSIQSIIPEGSVDDVVDAYHLGRMSLKLLEDDTYKKYLYMKEIL